MSKPRLIQQLGFGGLIHLWGKAGSGKTLLACKIASDESRFSKVEWINTDAKQSFIPQLKRLVEVEGGEIDNISVTLVSDRQTMREVILGLGDSIDPDVRLIVIDPITRLLDMAHQDPNLWGRELIEEVLPTLAGIVNRHSLNIIITSESRTLEDSNTIAVHHRTIAQWADHDVCLIKDDIRDSSRLFEGAEGYGQIGIFRFSDGSLTLSGTRQEVEVES